MNRYYIFLKKIVINDKKILLFIFLFAFILRIAFILSIENKFYFSDSLEYEDCAISVLKEQDFGDYTRAPLYPLWMSMIYFLNGEKNIVLIRIFESCLGALICVFVFYLGVKIFTLSTGVIAAIISALFPMFILLSGLQYPTLLSTFLITSGVYLTLLLDNQNRKRLSIFIGITFGLSALAVAPTATLVLSIVGWIAFFSNLNSGRKFIHVSIILVSFVLTITPWIIRNYIYYHEFVPIRYGATEHIFLYAKKRIISQKSIETKNSYIFQNPSFFFKQYGREFLRFWEIAPQKSLVSANPGYNLNVYEKDKRITKINKFSISKMTDFVCELTYGPIFFFTILGLLLIRNHWRKTLLLIFTILTLALTYSLFISKMRYRIPIEPLIIVIAAYSIKKSFEIIRAKFLYLFKQFFNFSKSRKCNNYLI